MGDYGFYVTLDLDEENEEENEEKYKIYNLIIDNEEKNYYRNKRDKRDKRDKDIEIPDSWNIIDTIKCLWYIIQLVVTRRNI